MTVTIQERILAAQAHLREADQVWIVNLLDELKAALSATTAGVGESIKRVLRLAVYACELRGGDIDTEDGCKATTDIDTLINLEAALCSALGASSDDAEMAELGPKIDALSASERVSDEQLSMVLEAVEAWNDDYLTTETMFSFVKRRLNAEGE